MNPSRISGSCALPEPFFRLLRNQTSMTRGSILRCRKRAIHPKSRATFFKFLRSNFTRRRDAPPSNLCQGRIRSEPILVSACEGPRSISPFFPLQLRLCKAHRGWRYEYFLNKEESKLRAL